MNNTIIYKEYRPMYLKILKELNNRIRSMQLNGKYGLKDEIDNSWHETLGWIEGAASITKWTGCYYDWFFKRIRDKTNQTWKASRKEAHVFQMRQQEKVWQEERFFS